MLDNRARTKGGVILEDIKIGDTLYEYEYGHCIKSVVLSQPKRKETADGEIQWTWTSEICGTEDTIDYMLTEGYQHYGPNLYDYEAYIKPERLR